MVDLIYFHYSISRKFKQNFVIILMEHSMYNTFQIASAKSMLRTKVRYVIFANINYNLITELYLSPFTSTYFLDVDEFIFRNHARYKKVQSCFTKYSFSREVEWHKKVQIPILCIVCQILSYVKISMYHSLQLEQ